MTKTGLLFGVALALAVTAAQAAENPYSANYLMPGCRDYLRRNNDGFFMQGRCAGLIEGLLYLDNFTCPPKEVIMGQKIRVVVAYIDARPARMHEDFYELALEALRAAWPCK
jgi:hypothetical protein